MGCDIHFHAEVKIKGVWHHHAEQKIERNYGLFAKMANVRNPGDIEEISNPKGIPEDATLITKMHVEKMGSDGHSHSFLNASEIVELHDFIEDKKTPDFWFGEYRWKFINDNLPRFLGNHFDSFKKSPEDWEDYEIEDVRYVFFFDN